MAAQKVSLYVRERGTRKLAPANPGKISVGRDLALWRAKEERKQEKAARKKR